MITNRNKRLAYNTIDCASWCNRGSGCDDLCGCGACLPGDRGWRLNVHVRCTATTACDEGQTEGSKKGHHEVTKNRNFHARSPKKLKTKSLQT
jgi:hypothetical protein